MAESLAVVQNEPEEEDELLKPNQQSTMKRWEVLLASFWTWVQTLIQIPSVSRQVRFAKKVIGLLCVRIQARGSWCMIRNFG